MSALIRVATLADAADIAAISSEAFGEKPDVDSIRLTKALKHGKNFVAIRDTSVVGFVGNFLTRSASGVQRFELDLLAVAEDARGGGIGRALASASIDAGKLANVDLIRTLVAADNKRMQRLCLSQGFIRDHEQYALHVSAVESMTNCGKASSPAGLHEAHLITVETLTYSGIWLEGRLSQAAIEDARQRARYGGMSRVGAVAPLSDDGLQALLGSNGFDLVGEFHWWTINL